MDKKSSKNGIENMLNESDIRSSIVSKLIALIYSQDAAVSIPAIKILVEMSDKKEWVDWIEDHATLTVDDLMSKFPVTSKN